MSRSNQPLDPELTIDPFAIASLTGPDNHTGLFLDADQVNSSVLLRTNDTNAIYVDKFQNIGINTISPAAQLDINAADGKCVQLTYNGSSNKASLQVASDGKLALIASGGEVSIDAASDFNIKSHDGSSIGLKLNDTLVRASADQINYNVVTPGTAAASKAIVLDSSRDITNIRNLTASQLTGTIQTASQPNITSVATLDITAHDGSQGLALGGILLNATAAQLNYNVVTPGTSSANKALVVDANKDITSIRNLTASQLTGTLQTAAQPNITSVGTLLGLDIDGSFTGLATLGIATTTAGRTLVVNSDVGNCIQLCYDTTSGTANTYVDMLVSSAGDLTVTASGGNVNISSHNGTDKGLKLGGTLVVSTADQINYLSGSTPGAASGGKALIFDFSRNVNNINNLTASQLTGTLQTAAQPNINSVNVLNIANHNGSTLGLQLNNTLVTATATELNYVDTTPGTAEASKALVLDSGGNIAGLTSLSATDLTGTLQTAVQTNITSVGTLDNIATSGTFTMGSTVISAAEIGVLDGVTPGTAAASKALVLDTNKDIATIRNLTATNLTGTLQTAAQPNITSVGTLDNIATSGTFTMGSTVISAAEIGVLDGVTPGTAAASKALVLDTNKDIATIRNLTATNLTGTLQTAYQPNVTSVDTLDITAHNGSTTGLYLGGALVTATAAQINSMVGGSGTGTFEDLTVNGWLDIVNANGTTIGLKLDGTLVTATADELNCLSGTTPGVANINKALVTDNNNRIDGIDTVTATNFVGTVQTAAQPTITSLGTLTSLGVSSATSTNTFTSSWNSVNNNTITLANTGNGFAGGINITGFNGSGVAKNVIRFAPVYGTTTSGSETTGCNFYALAAGTEYTPFQILSTGGCKVARASANGTVLAVGGAISSANQYGDLTFEGTGVTLLRQRAIYVNSDTSKMELYGRSGGSDALMTTFAYGTSGGVLTSLESVTSGKLISTIGSSGIGLQHINSSISLATIIDSSNARGCFGTTTNHDAYLFTNNRSTNPSLILEASTNFVKINTNITGSSGALGASLGVRGGIQNNCDTVTLNTSTGTCLLGSTALISPYTANPWLDSQLVPFNTPTSLGFGSMQRGQLFVEAGYFTSTYTETYTFTVTYKHTFYKIWVNGKLLGNNLSINSSSTNTQTFTLALVASTRNSIYIQILPQNATGGSCSLSVSYQSTSQSSTAVPINASSGTEKYISTEPLSCPSVFTIYDQTTASSALLKSELTTNSSGNLNIFASGLTTLIDSTNSFNIAGHNGTTIGLKLGGTLVTATAEQLDYTTASPGTASANKALVVDGNKDIASINSLVAAQLTGEIQTAAQPNITSVGTLSGITTSGTFTMGTTAISEAEIGVIDNVTPGTAAASKALVLDSSSDISGINALSASELTGELQTAAQPNITSVGTLSSITTSGSLTLGATSISEGEIGVLDGVTPGTATASKALVLNSSKGISGITSLASTSIAVGSPANSNLPVEIGYTSYQFTGAYAYSNDVNAHGIIDAGNGPSANYSLRADGRILVTGEVEITSDRRLKKDIVALTPELCKSFILTTTPVRFNWKSDDTIPDYGYIAQDVLKAGFNDLVTVVPQPDMEGSVDDDGFINPAGAKYVFSPGKIIPMVALNQRQLFEANDAKDVEIADLKERLSALESLVSQLLQK